MIGILSNSLTKLCEVLCLQEEKGNIALLESAGSGRGGKSGADLQINNSTDLSGVQC